MDEFALSGLTPEDGKYVKAPFVKESPAILECELWKVIDLPGSNRADLSGSYVVFGHVIGIHIDDSYIKDGLFDTRKAKPLGRLGYMDYGVINDGNIFSKDDLSLIHKERLSLNNYHLELMSKEFFNNSIYTKELITRSENITFTKESSFHVMKRAASLL